MIIIKRKKDIWDTDTFLEKLKYKISNIRTEFHMWINIKQGYQLPDGQPIKCRCGCTDLEDYGEYYEEHWIIEYSTKCKKCGRKLGHWAYGNWER